MPDVPYPKPKPPTRTDRARERALDVWVMTKRAVRSALTGNPDGHIRRPVLFIVAGVGSLLGGPAGVIGFIAILILALTDQVVEL